ncbi:MAG: hypothetical protein NTZ68_03275 [Candidatus Dependentiae bacterium]|nr:hypothetical protein [Candidatus Dependentiae bacterium]
MGQKFMISNMFFISIVTILSGIMYGSLFYVGKKYSLAHSKPAYDFIFTLLRFSLLILFFYTISTFVASNSILLTILFVSSYLCSVGILAYKM